MLLSNIYLSNIKKEPYSVRNGCSSEFDPKRTQRTESASERDRNAPVSRAQHVSRSHFRNHQRQRPSRFRANELVESLSPVPQLLPVKSQFDEEVARWRAHGPELFSNEDNGTTRPRTLPLREPFQLTLLQDELENFSVVRHPAWASHNSEQGVQDHAKEESLENVDSIGWRVELVVHDNTLASPVVHADAENHPKAGADLANHRSIDEPTAQTHALDFVDKASIKDLDVVPIQEDDIAESGHQNEEQGAESCDTLSASASPNKSTTITALAIIVRETNSTPPTMPTQLFDWIVNLEVTRSRLFQVVIRATSVLRAPLVSALFAANVDMK
ncbi:hypothetical protein LTS18_005422, partial [Coniosporium uncinatum]